MIRNVLLLSSLLVLPVLGGCVTDDEPTDPTPTESAGTETRPADSGSVSTLSFANERIDRTRLDDERYDASWRSSADLDRRERGPRSPQGSSDQDGSPPPDGDDATARSQDAEPPSAEGQPPIERVRRAVGPSGADSSATPAASPNGEPESWEDIGPGSVNVQARLPLGPDAAGPTVLYLQVLLDNARFSPGAIDGRWGKNTEKAVYWLQDSLDLEPTGEVDQALFDRLQQAMGSRQAIRQYRLTAEDLAGPFQPVPEDVAEQAEMDCLCYESLEEALAERFHSSPELLTQLNPDLDLATLQAGQSIWVPSVAVIEENMDTPDTIDRLVVSKKGFYLHALDAQGRVVYHFPSTLGTDYDPTPGSGEYQINSHAYKPAFHYQPKLFEDVPDEEAEHMLPGGPNSPVGAVWLDLSKPHYGIHGTSEPESIGYTTSHGCIRLTNWDAVFLANHVADGTTVEFRQ